MFTRFRLKEYDFKLILMVILISVIGIFVIGSAEEELQFKHMLGVIGGFVLMIILSFLNYSFVLKFYWLLYILNIILLLAVMLIGSEGGGAQRWLAIGGLTFQPSETAKILLILFYAKFIMKYREKLNTIKIIAACIVLAVVPVLMIYKQPDLSTSMVVVVLFCVLMFAGEISIKLVITVLAVSIPAAAIIISLAINPEKSLLSDYQQDRILAFVHPEEYANEEAYQQLNSVMAIGSGQLNGKGYKNNEISSVKNGNFISEAQTDFIFAVIGEEFGFKGAVVVIILLMAISIECLNCARKAKDLGGRIICAGVGSLIAFQSFFNIGVATFILPNTGLPLPFISNGLTSMICMFAGIGFVLNVRLQAKRGTKDKLQGGFVA